MTPMCKCVLIFNFMNAVNPAPYTWLSHHIEWARGDIREGLAGRAGRGK